MMKKRGQITIFVIIALLIVALGILIYMFFPEIQSVFRPEPKSPQAFLETCLEDKILEGVELASKQGGSINPEFSFFYEGDEIRYLCYINEYYQPCKMQVSSLKGDIESELENYIEEDVESCLVDMEDSYEKRGYSVELQNDGFNIELLPNRVTVNLDSELTLRKDESQRYNEFDISLNNNLYELISIATSIIQWEIEYGDAETTMYMNYYPDLKVEKMKQDDGTTIYRITERSTENKFQFASRSYAWPPGYGVGEMTD